jgi:hypothetical protein
MRHPVRMTTSEPDDLSQVISNELQLLDPAVRACSAAVRALLHDEFREFGASGSTWDRATVVTAMTEAPGEAVTTRDMQAVRLAPDVVLLIYVAQSPGRTTLRSSLWRRDEDGWKLFFHQGTLQQDRA